MTATMRRTLITTILASMLVVLFRLEVLLHLPAAEKAVDTIQAAMETTKMRKRIRTKREGREEIKTALHHHHHHLLTRATASERKENKNVLFQADPLLRHRHRHLLPLLLLLTHATKIAKKQQERRKSKRTRRR